MQGLGSLVHVFAVFINCSHNWMRDSWFCVPLLRALTRIQNIVSESTINNTMLWYFNISMKCMRRCDSSVDIETMLRAGRPTNLGSIPGTSKTFFSSPKHPDRLWGPPDLLSSGYRWVYPRGWSGPDVKLRANLHLLARSGMRGVIPSLPHRLHGVVLN
jgi:hypothetical protein